MAQKNRSTSLITILTVFYFWGFVAASNGIFIPFCKTHFNLSQFESQLIDFAFYLAYFAGSMLLWGFSQLTGIEMVHRWGFKKGIIIGLSVSALGSLLMIPAVHLGDYLFILCAFFVIALGFSLQQTCAQPFVIAMGSPETGSHRLNLAGGINSLGTLLGPILVSKILFGDIQGAPKENIQIASIDQLYYILAGVFILAILLLSTVKLSNNNQNETFERGLGALKYPQLRWGMLAIFTYVGVEVSIQSNLGALLKLPEFGSYPESNISQFISLYWGSLMIGRWAGAVSAFNLSKLQKRLLTVIVPFIAFAVIILVNLWRGSDVNGFYIYSVCIAILVIGFLASKENPARMLLIFGLLGMIAMITGLCTTGDVAVYAFISGGLFCSIMWPCIFALSINGLGKYTGQGSTFLIMMILGGAIIPPLQGILADKTSIHLSYLIPVVCFGYLAWFAIKVQKELLKQGLTVAPKIESKDLGVIDQPFDKH